MLPPTNNEELQAFYRERLSSLEREQKRVSSRRATMRIFLLLCAALAVALVAHDFDIPRWLALVPVGAFVLGLPFYLRLRAQSLQLQRLAVFHETNLARANGSETQSGNTGEEFLHPEHLYARDLNVLGTNSLFALLATTRTGIGQRGLAQALLEPAGAQQTLERQQAVRELAPLTELREQIALLGPSRFHQVAASVFDEWLDDPPPSFHPAVRWTLIAASLSLFAVLLAGLLHPREWSTLLPNVAVIFAVQAAVALRVRSRVVPILEASRVANQMQLFADGIALLDQQSFHCARLLALQQMCREPVRATSSLRSIQNQFVIVDQRNSQYFYVVSLLISAGTHAAIAIANWKRRYGSEMRRWIAAWGEFEALVALANYAFEHPQDVYPTLESGTAPAAFEANALGHPLLPEQTCVRNDITLNASTRFYLISGSNMAGKSTLLRAIGLNAVLAYAGAPVRASSLRLTPLAIGASLALTDSLAEGKSKFLAEVQRLEAILTLSRTSPTLFLVDELFSGTNSQDRSLAAEAVLRILVENGALGALSTHDLALTVLADDKNHGINLHMASPDPNDPLAFDFRLKPGVNPSSNALAIIRMMGIKA